MDLSDTPRSWMDAYEIDTVAWSERQAGLLRRMAAGERLSTAPDWSNIAEEIESLGKTQRRELGSRILTILVHLMKLEASPAIDPVVGWRATVRRERDEISALLEDSPSLRGHVSGAIGKGLDRARAEVAASLADNGETPRRGIASLIYAEDQVLGDWLP